MLTSFCDPDLSTDCPVFCSGGDTCTVCTVSEVSRNLYDDVCDYNGLSDIAGAVDRSTNPISGLGNYNINVTVDDGSDGSEAVLNTLSSATNQVIRVDVNVTHDTYTDLDQTLSGYRSNY